MVNHSLVIGFLDLYSRGSKNFTSNRHNLAIGMIVNRKAIRQTFVFRVVKIIIQEPILLKLPIPPINPTDFTPAVELFFINKKIAVSLIHAMLTNAHNPVGITEIPFFQKISPTPAIDDIIPKSTLIHNLTIHRNCPKSIFLIIDKHSINLNCHHRPVTPINAKFSKKLPIPVAELLRGLSKNLAINDLTFNGIKFLFDFIG
jgi:hypothetical protein